MTGRERLQALRSGGKLALARSLTEIEAAARAPGTIELLDAAWAEPRAHVVGLTGPPGVGKSTLLSALIGAWRAAGTTIGVIAVDPSSRRTGGALLGDRTRLALEPDDPGCFVRSMAARDRLGGLAELCFPAMVLMRALFDLVLVETVGVGQSETEVGDLVDTVLFAVQPASGDSLQFMKSGIAEIPDVAVVTKADLGPPALLAAKELEAAFQLLPPRDGDWRAPVLLASAPHGEGIVEIVDAIRRHREHLLAEDRLANLREQRTSRWIEQIFTAELGRRGVQRLRQEDPILWGRIPPFARAERLLALLAA